MSEAEKVAMDMCHLEEKNTYQMADQTAVMVVMVVLLGCERVTLRRMRVRSVPTLEWTARV